MYDIVVAFGITLTIFTALAYYAIATYVEQSDNKISRIIAQYTNKVDESAAIGASLVLMVGATVSIFWPLAIVAAAMFPFYRKCIKIVHNTLNKIDEKFG